MKITVEETQAKRNRKATVEIDDHSDIFEVMDSFAGLLVSYGFHPDFVQEGFYSKIAEYEDEKTGNKIT